MSVFTDEWIRQMDALYAGSPVFQQPTLYLIARCEPWKGYRQWVEECIADLATYEDTAKVNDLIARLRSPDNYGQASNELRVFAVLRDMGYRPRYEWEFDGKKPDWYVQRAGNRPEFVVECFTKNVPEAVAKQAKRETELSERLDHNLSKCVLPAEFAVSIEHDRTRVLCVNRMKEIVRRVREWLMSNPPENNATTIEGTYFNIFAKKTPTVVPTARIWTFTPPQWDDSALRSKIEEKLGTYGRIFEARGIPFVVAVVAGEDYVLNPPRFQVAIHPLMQSADPRLSAVALAVKKDDRWCMKLIHNPHAAHPLPIGVLGEDISP